MIATHADERGSACSCAVAFACARAQVPTASCARPQSPCAACVPSPVAHKGTLDDVRSELYEQRGRVACRARRRRRSTVRLRWCPRDEARRRARTSAPLLRHTCAVRAAAAACRSLRVRPPPILLYAARVTRSGERRHWHAVGERGAAVSGASERARSEQCALRAVRRPVSCDRLASLSGEITSRDTCVVVRVTCVTRVEIQICMT